MSIDDASVSECLFEQQCRNSFASFVFEGELVGKDGWIIEEERVKGFVGVVVFPIFDDFGSQILRELLYECHSNVSIYRIINVLIPLYNRF